MVLLAPQVCLGHSETACTGYCFTLMLGRARERVPFVGQSWLAAPWRLQYSPDVPEPDASGMGLARPGENAYRMSLDVCSLPHSVPYNTVYIAYLLWT